MKSFDGQSAGVQPAASAKGNGGGVEAAPFRVLHIVAAGEYGGAEAQVLDLLKGLGANGVPAAVAVLFDAEFAARARDAGVEVHVLPGGAPWRDFGALLRLVRQWRPDLLHTHGVRASVAGRLVGVRTGLRVVTTVHSDLYYDYAAPAKRALFMALELATQELSARVIAVSRPLAGVLRKRGYAERKLRVVENGIDVRAFEEKLSYATHDGSGANIRRELALPDGALVILCVARLHPVKLHDVLIRATGELGKTMDAVHLVLVGDGSERAALQALATQAAPGRVHFLGARADVPALLAQADVFALTSRMEGLPISVLEAMAARLPVVASRAGGLAELVADAGAVAADRTTVQDAPTGFLFEPGSTEGLRAALAILLRDAGLRRELGAAGRERLLARFTTERMVQGTMDVYRETASYVNASVV